jgi:hypothetical protein
VYFFCTVQDNKPKIRETTKGLKKKKKSASLSNPSLSLLPVLFCFLVLWVSFLHVQRKERVQVRIWLSVCWCDQRLRGGGGDWNETVERWSENRRERREKNGVRKVMLRCTEIRHPPLFSHGRPYFLPTLASFSSPPSLWMPCMHGEVSSAMDDELRRRCVYMGTDKQHG